MKTLHFFSCYQYYLLRGYAQEISTTVYRMYLGKKKNMHVYKYCISTGIQIHFQFLPKIQNKFELAFRSFQQNKFNMCLKKKQLYIGNIKSSHENLFSK